MIFFKMHSAAGYIKISKEFVGKKTHTSCTITNEGKLAFEEYVDPRFSISFKFYPWPMVRIYVRRHKDRDRMLKLLFISLMG